MFDALVADVAALRVGELSRDELTDLAAGVGRAKSALGGLLDRIALATDDLGDGGPDGAGVVAGTTKESTRSARARVRKARTLKKMPNTARETWRVESARSPTGSIGHVNFFREPMKEVFWDRIASWLNAQSAKTAAHNYD